MTEHDTSGWLSERPLYACPKCKGPLKAALAALRCPICGRTYKFRGEIPDFIVSDGHQTSTLLLQKAKSIDRLARIYETRLWYPLVLNLAAGWGRISLAKLIALVQEMIGPFRGNVLDVACGPGTYGRRVATASRNVYAIDLSYGMLERGLVYAQREGVTNIHFARALVEDLPFGNSVFDAAICGGSLHLFPDPLFALREIGRTLRPGAALAVMTFTAGRGGVLRFRSVLRHAGKKGFRVFGSQELEQILGEAGYENYLPATYGSLLIFRAQKAPFEHFSRQE